jgi:hypothetical protein
MFDKIGKESTPGSQIPKPLFGLPVIMSDNFPKEANPIILGKMDRYIQKLLIIEVDTRDVENYHRGLRYTIAVEEDDERGGISCSL